ncbi:MAG TPA: hypothetical protein VI895_13250, partial [Bdellovibrionota bacterium]|nr:hypothetical protein [Bdellovibrionota bacterium]
MKGWVKKGKGGFVVVLALIALMAMSFFLMTGAATTTSSVKVSGNYTKTVDVFDIAEVGVARGRKLMEGKTFDQLLALYPSGVMISKTPFNGGNYEVRIRDNDIDDQGAPNPKENGNPATDADNLLVLTSYGYGKSGGSVQIETHQQIMTGITFPPSPGMPGSGQGPTGALLCGTTTDAKTSGGGEITGHDYNIPPELMDSDPTTWCTGTGCDGSDQTPTSGGGYAVAGESAVNTTGSGFESNLTPEVLANTGANSHCSDWRAIRDQ